MENFNTILNRYKILGTLGSGGFGTVKIAWDTRIQRKVAIKIIELNEGEIQRASLLEVSSPLRESSQDGPNVSAGDGSDQRKTKKVNVEQDLYLTEYGKKEDDPYRKRWRGLVPWKEYLKLEDKKIQDEDTGTVLLDDGETNDSDVGDDSRINEDADCSQTDKPTLHVQDKEGNPVPNNNPQDASSPNNETLDQDLKTSLANLPGLDEARAAAKLTSPHIVGVYDFEVSGYCAYLIMEYIDGITLTQLLRSLENDISIDEISAIFEAVTRALSTAHKRGVLHLDIKPDNILISVDGDVKVTDFGLAKLADLSTDITAGGGTIGYMPLEQMKRETLDAKADQWAIASVLYEMLTGSNPFLGRTIDEAEHKIKDANLLLPSIFWEGVSEEFDDVIFKALSIAKEERYKTVSAFYKDAHRYLGNPKRGIAELKQAVAWCMQPPAEQEPEEAEVRDKQKTSLIADIVSSYREKNKKEESPSHDRAPVRDTFDSIDDEHFDDRYYEQEAEEYYQELIDEKKSKIKDAFNKCVPFLKSAAGCALSAFIAWFSLTNISLIGTIFPQAPLFFILPIVVIVGIAGAFSSHLGALFSFSLLGLAVALQGCPQVGVPFIFLTAAWWYLIGRNYEESSLVVLFMPLLATGGSSTYAPFICGLFLKPFLAFISIIYMSLVALVLASVGDTLLVGWNFFNSFSFAQGDIFALFLKHVTQMSTWATVAGWVLSATALSATRMSKSKIIRFMGVIVAVASVFVGTLLFGATTPQLLFAGIVSSGILVIDFARSCNPY